MSSLNVCCLMRRGEVCRLLGLHTGAIVPEEGRAGAPDKRWRL